MCLAVPGELVEIREGAPLAREGRVSFDGVIKTVSLAFLPEVRVGEFVLVHAGVAISTVDATEARNTLQYLKEIDDLDLAGESDP